MPVIYAMVFRSFVIALVCNNSKPRDKLGYLKLLLIGSSIDDDSFIKMTSNLHVFATRWITDSDGIFAGIFEPEFRLVLIGFFALFSCIGFFGWG